MPPGNFKKDKYFQMKKYTLFIIAGTLLTISSCTKDTPIVPPVVTPPTTNVITISDGGNSAFDINPVCSFVNFMSLGTSMFTINMKINNSSTFNLSLTVYGDTTDVGSFTAYNSLKDAEDFSQFSNDGHGSAYNINSYIVDSAVVKVTSYQHSRPSYSDQVAGTFQLWLQPNNNTLAKHYKTITGTFNTTFGNTFYQ